MHSKFTQLYSASISFTVAILFMLTAVVYLGMPDDAAAQNITTGNLKERQLQRRYKKNTPRYNEFVARRAAHANQTSTSKKGYSTKQLNKYEEFLKTRDKRIQKTTAVNPEYKRKINNRITSFMEDYSKKQKNIRPPSINSAVVQKQLNRMQLFLNNQQEKNKIAGIGSANKVALEAKKRKAFTPRYDGFLANQKSKTNKLLDTENRRTRLILPPSPQNSGS